MTTPKSKRKSPRKQKSPKNSNDKLRTLVETQAWAQILNSERYNNSHELFIREVSHRPLSASASPTVLHTLLQMQDLRPSKLLPRVIGKICSGYPAALCIRDRHGRTPLHLAASNLDVLVSACYSISCTSTFDMLFHRSRPPTLETLANFVPLPFDIIENYIFPYAAYDMTLEQNAQGWSVLHVLIMMRAPASCMELCLRHCKADIARIRNDFGATPLHLACFYLSSPYSHGGGIDSCSIASYHGTGPARSDERMYWRVFVELVRALPKSVSWKDGEGRMPLEIVYRRHYSDSCDIDDDILDFYVDVIDRAKCNSGFARYVRLLSFH